MNPIDVLWMHLRHDWPNLDLEIQRPRHPSGVWSLDVRSPVTNLVIDWNPTIGIGVSRTDRQSYGEGHDFAFPTLDQAEVRIKRMLNPVYLAIDTPDPVAAREMIDLVGDYIGGIKIGLTYWFANERTTVAKTVAGYDWFLDVKLYDIPMQVEGALRSVVALRPAFISVHVGELKENANEDERAKEEMMLLMAKHAVEQQAAILRVPQPKLLAVTITTHLPA